jgi:hypothetical protein
MDSQIQDIWVQYGYPSANRLFSIAKDKIDGVKLKDIQSFLEKQETQQLHKKDPIDNNPRPITTIESKLDYQADLLDLQKYSRNNKGFNWVLLVEDIFTRKAYAEGIKTKSPNDVLPALNRAFDYLGKPRLNLTTDNGGEFKGVVDKKLADLKIVHRTTEVGNHRILGVIDSLCRFVKNSLHKHFTNTQSTNWIDYLSKLITNYNNTPHSSLKADGEPAMSPNEADKYQVKTLFIHSDKVEDYLAKKEGKVVKFHVGDTVKIRKRKMAFDRGYEIKWSIPNYHIVMIEGNYYILSNGKRYHETELQKVVPKQDVSKPSEDNESDAVVNEKKDVADIDKRKHRTENILKFQEGVDQKNRREGLRERKPKDQVEHSRYGKIVW